MLQDLDTTLDNLLSDPAAPAALSSSEVSFAVPEKAFTPQQADTAVNLFLYEVRENRELRDPVPIRRQAGENVEQRRPPIRVDCAYMVTAWSKSQTKIVDEHRLLGLAFAWLSRFPVIPARFFAGSLAGQPFPPPSMIAQWDSARNVGEFWSALSIPPRPFFNLIVTIAMDLDLHISSPQVTTITTEFLPLGADTSEPLAAIGGYALDFAAGAPVAVSDAMVNLETAGGGVLKSAHSDATGRFVFDRLVPGSYRIWGHAPGRAPTPAQSIQIPSPNGAYVLRF